ncbi:MAG: amidohydrolase [Saprospiraceae bacterium]|nr:amidohydrolase [Saprospiraceae bacterium]
MNPVITAIKEKVKDILPEVVSIRRHLHQHPELSFQETETSAFLRRILDQHQIEYRDNLVGTGFVAEITGGQPGPVRAFRAELDALPIEEMTELPYKSMNLGIMHACGHDVHSACLLGACLVLNEMKAEIKGRLLFVFQPGEEKLPGGASLMLADNVFGAVLPVSIVAQHVFPELKAGEVGICAGLYMASSDEIYISIKGKGGHAAMPHNCIDPIVLASEVVLALQQIISRHGNPIIPSVLTIGKIESTGGATNVIPDEVKMEGTFRTMDEAWREKAHSHIISTVEHICLAKGATAEVKLVRGYPCLINEGNLTAAVKDKMVDFMGIDKVHDIPKRMTSEDFAFFAQQIPACFFRLGVSDQDGKWKHGVHSPHFQVDETALEVGVGLMVWLAL